MNNRGRIILIGGGAIIFLLVLGLGIYSLTRSQPTSSQGVTYTDIISGEKFTAFAKTTDQHENGEADQAPFSEVSVSGLDSFVSTLGQDASQSVLADITQFIRARVGASGAHAGALNAQVTKTASNPTRYEFTLVLINPASRYKVTITMPATGTATPLVTFGEVAQ